MSLKEIIRERAKKSYFIRVCFNAYCALLFKRNPKILANKDYKRVMGKDIDWDTPKNLIEKIYWMLFNSDTSLWSLCADKYEVRKFVEERGCGYTLNEIYGSWDKVEEIDYNNLPNSFVLKTTNSSGQVIIVEDKSKLNIDKVNEKLKRWLNVAYGLSAAQLHYLRIKPRIIAEQLLKNNQSVSSSLVDYKIWCFNGMPESVLVVFDRKGEDYKLSSFDLDWNNISDKVLKPTSVHYSGAYVAKPASFDKMLDVAKKLSAGFPEVRVDFYDIDNEPVFGEMTFSTGYGYYKDSYYDYLGGKIDLASIKQIPTEEIISEFVI